MRGADLQSEPKRERTVIRALVQILPEADFIIALATTGDDLVRPLDRPRAKATLAALRNVIFEVGDPGVELPSDLAGVLYEFRDRWRAGPERVAQRRPTRRPRRDRLTRPRVHSPKGCLEPDAVHLLGEPVERNGTRRAARSRLPRVPPPGHIPDLLCMRIDTRIAGSDIRVHVS